MKTSDIQMIAFDLFGVIIEEGHLISNGLVLQLPDPVDRAKVKQLYEAYNLQQIQESAFWQGLAIHDYTDIRRSFLDSFRLDTQVDQVIPQVKNAYRLSILSNLPADWADELIKRFRLNSDFTPCIFSGHVAQKKPGAAIYQRLLEQSGLPATSIAFIDDRLENLLTAHQLGFTTIYFQREIEQHGYQPDYAITQLSDLLAIFTAGLKS